jgi:hypothetical protein
MGLSINGIIFLVLAWGIILSLVIISFYKVFKTQKKK